MPRYFRQYARRRTAQRRLTPFVMRYGRGRLTRKKAASSYIQRYQSSLPMYYSENPTVIARPAEPPRLQLSSFDIPLYKQLLIKNGYQVADPGTNIVHTITSIRAYYAAVEFTSDQNIYNDDFSEVELSSNLVPENTNNISVGGNFNISVFISEFIDSYLITFVGKNSGSTNGVNIPHQTPGYVRTVYYTGSTIRNVTDATTFELVFTTPDTRVLETYCYKPNGTTYNKSWLTLPKFSYDLSFLFDIDD